MHFIRTKYSSLDGKTKIRFKEEDQDFFVEASLQGIEFGGKLEISDRIFLDALAKAIGDAWTEHTKLLNAVKKTLRTNERGH